jgi:N-methylhydantoinase B/oxoprolinase/acetone carboxylase alpha subunit
MGELDKDFDSLVDQINAKLASAAEALREANELRSKAGLESFIFSAWMRDEAYREIRNRIEDEENRKADSSEIYDEIEKRQEMYERFDVRALENELGSGGWSISSSYC